MLVGYVNFERNLHFDWPVLRSHFNHFQAGHYHFVGPLYDVLFFHIILSYSSVLPCNPCIVFQRPIQLRSLVQQSMNRPTMSAAQS